jgi:hypothetical protein
MGTASDSCETHKWNAQPCAHVCERPQSSDGVNAPRSGGCVFGGFNGVVLCNVRGGWWCKRVWTRETNDLNDAIRGSRVGLEKLSRVCLKDFWLAVRPVAERCIFCVLAPVPKQKRAHNPRQCEWCAPQKERMYRKQRRARGGNTRRTTHMHYNRTLLCFARPAVALQRAHLALAAGGWLYDTVSRQCSAARNAHDEMTHEIAMATHKQRALSSVFSATNFFGLKGVPLCDPSQKG